METQYLDKILNLDCMEGMRLLPDSCVDLVLDPFAGSGTQTLVTPKGRETFRLLYLKTA